MPRVRLLGWFWWAPIFYAEISTSLSLCERTDDNETEGEGERSLVRFGDKWVSGIVIGNSFIFASHQSERQRRLLRAAPCCCREENDRGEGAVMMGQVTQLDDVAWELEGQFLIFLFRAKVCSTLMCRLWPCVSNSKNENSECVLQPWGKTRHGR